MREIIYPLSKREERLVWWVFHGFAALLAVVVAGLLIGG